MKPSDAKVHGTLELRWERIGIGVRCAFNPQRPDTLHHYVQAGRRLSRLQPEREARIQRRMLELLLHTADDEALPWQWRAVCLEHTAWPLARLTSLLGGCLAAAGTELLTQLEQRVLRVGEQLGLPPAPTQSIAGVEPVRSPGSQR